MKNWDLKTYEPISYELAIQKILGQDEQERQR